MRVGVRDWDTKYIVVGKISYLEEDEHGNIGQEEWVHALQDRLAVGC